MVTVDAKGLFCPEPLMMAQEALKANPGETVVVEVDSASPRDNILRLVRRKKLSATVEEVDGVFTITITQ
ncbi:MAG: sulfurtransferase TusA family protein [Eggerthellaceae bacterium]